MAPSCRHSMMRNRARRCRSPPRNGARSPPSVPGGIREPSDTTEPKATASSPWSSSVRAYARWRSVSAAPADTPNRNTSSIRCSATPMAICARCTSIQRTSKVTSSAATVPGKAAAGRSPLRSFLEDALRQPHVYAVIRLVDQLCHRDISSDAHQLIRLMLREMFLRDEKIDHLLNRTARRNRQIRVGRHADVVGRRFRARPCKLHVFAYSQAQAATQRGFDRGLIHRAVALRGMTVAYLEQRAGHEHRDVKRAAGHQLAIVEIARMAAWRIAADATRVRRRRDAHAAEKRSQRNHDAGQEL